MDFEISSYLYKEISDLLYGIIHKWKLIIFIGSTIFLGKQMSQTCQNNIIIGEKHFKCFQPKELSEKKAVRLKEVFLTLFFNQFNV